MTRIFVARINVNQEALERELRQSLGTLIVSGLAVSPDGVAVHVADGASPVEIVRCRQLIEQHDESALTPEQQIDAERRRKLEAARTANNEPIDPTIGEGEATVIQILVSRIAWLEQEIADLRAE